MEINDEYIINEFINKNGKPSCIKFNNKWCWNENCASDYIIHHSDVIVKHKCKRKSRFFVNRTAIQYKGGKMC